MRGFYRGCQLVRVLMNRPTIADNSVRLEPTQLCHSYHCSLFPGIMDGNSVNFMSNYQRNAVQSRARVLMQSRLFSSEVDEAASTPTEAVKEKCDNMMDSILKKRTAPPNALLRSMIAECASHEDIKLLFDVLQLLRRFRLANLRIHDNFNSALCLEVTKACVRVGAIDYGKKALWKHNLYGLTPMIGSAHQLLLYAKQQNDVRLMENVMGLLRRNKLPLQSGTADIVFSICYETNNWDLICKYGKRFVKEGVNLRQSSIELWMDFAAKTGDVNCLWEVEKLRSDSNRQHTPVSGIACAKGHLLEKQPRTAAEVIELLIQALPDKKPQIISQLEKLVAEWPLEVINRQKTENKEALAVSLQNDIPAMVAALANFGLGVKANLEDLTRKAGVSS